ncbi:hypothetical protein PINS_up020766 [Pythium insidiosum]|nr:hypothetical protein PINS_up003536 [Pythium insidiosum]GLE09175.1 hypothetical protein PINS_up020766 [Pythium insidiosum]
MALYSEVTSAVEKLEERVSEGSKALLTREMQIHELSQQNSALELRVEALEKERDHWENEYASAHDASTTLARVHQQIQDECNEKTKEIGSLKAKLHALKKAADELQKLNTAARIEKHRLSDEMEKQQLSLLEREKKWEARLKKRNATISQLKQQLFQLKSMHEELEEHKRDLANKEAEWKSHEASLQIEKRQQLLVLRDEMRCLQDENEKARVNEMLLKKELCRLREELLLSESQRKTEQRRCDQLVKAKEKEMAFVWRKYVDAVCPANEVRSCGDKDFK